MNLRELHTLVVGYVARGGGRGGGAGKWWSGVGIRRGRNRVQIRKCKDNIHCSYSLGSFLLRMTYLILTVFHLFSEGVEI